MTNINNNCLPSMLYIFKKPKKSIAGYIVIRSIILSSPGVNNKQSCLNYFLYTFMSDFCFQRFFHETVDQNDHVMVRINTPYQQEQPQLFLKNASIPPIADLSFHTNTVLSNAGLPSKPIKDKSHNYTNRFGQFLYAFTKMYYFFFFLFLRAGTIYQKVHRTPNHRIRRPTALANLRVRHTILFDLFRLPL
jgi:hypothetical protein